MPVRGQRGPPRSIVGPLFDGLIRALVTNGPDFWSLDLMSPERLHRNQDGITAAFLILMCAFGPILAADIPEYHSQRPMIHLPHIVRITCTGSPGIVYLAAPLARDAGGLFNPALPLRDAFFPGYQPVEVENSSSNDSESEPPEDRPEVNTPRKRARR